MRLDVALELLRDPQQASFIAVREAGNKAADTIDSLVAALESARDKFEGIRHDVQFHANDATMTECERAIDHIDVALALARVGK